jgi:hypothetical protein
LELGGAAAHPRRAETAVKTTMKSHQQRMCGALAAGLIGLLASAATPAFAQVGGNLAQLPAVDLQVAITTAPDGSPQISPAEIRLTTGEYYRLNVTSDGGAVWRIEADDLLQNSHLRILTINGVEVHLQGLAFRAIEFDEAGTASFTLTPIRPGAYALEIGRDPRPSGRPIGDTGIAPGPTSASLPIIVE